MRFLRNRRRAALVGATALAIGVMLGVVLPALGSTAGDYVAGPSKAGVLPLDYAIGGTKDCGNLFPNLSGYSEFDVPNPNKGSNVPSGNNDGATFSFSTSGNSKNQVLTLSSTGAAIVGIGIKGGTNSTAYDYVSGPYVTGSYPSYVVGSGSGSVTGDTDLHAPAQAISGTSPLTGFGTVEDPTQYYSISQLSVCYKQGSVSGTVYQDANVNGAFDSGETTLSGWTVRLYNSADALVGSATTDSSGAYHIGAVFDGTSDYRLCEVPSGTRAWAQTEPNGANATTCSGPGELKVGWLIHQPTTLQAVTANFGNVGAITCTTGPFGPTDYRVGTCKQGQTYVFSSGATPGGNPYVSYFVGDQNEGAVPTVERVTFPDPWNGGPKYSMILFEDSPGFQAPTDNLPQMPYCNVDPRDTSATGYPDSYTLEASPPSPQSINDSGATSCVISLKISAPMSSGGDGSLVAYIYSSTDSVRSAG